MGVIKAFFGAAFREGIFQHRFLHLVGSDSTPFSLTRPRLVAFHSTSASTCSRSLAPEKFSTCKNPGEIREFRKSCGGNSLAPL
jgi:hypothetical protein